MMDIMPATGHLPMVSAYGGGAFTINEHKHAYSIFVSLRGVQPVEGTLTPEASVSLETIHAHLPMLGDMPLEILLIGTGKTTHFMHPATRAALRERGIAVDVMDTGAASRTYNVLLGEGRQVAALLVVV
jgi:uncharacterized protein